MPRKIKQIDLLVHPFFNHIPGELEKKERDSYGDIEANIMMGIWKASIDKVARDESRILIFVGARINEREFEKMRDNKLKQPRDKDFSYEFELLHYAHTELGGRLFFTFYKITRKFLNDISNCCGDRLDPEKVVVNAYGEYITICVMTVLKTLVRGFNIPKKNVRLKPKKSVDAIDGYPRVWEIEELKELPPEIRQEVIRRKVEPYLSE